MPKQWYVINEDGVSTHMTQADALEYAAHYTRFVQLVCQKSKHSDAIAEMSEIAASLREYGQREQGKAD